VNATVSQIHGKSNLMLIFRACAYFHLKRKENNPPKCFRINQIF